MHKHLLHLGLATSFIASIAVLSGCKPENESRSEESTTAAATGDGTRMASVKIATSPQPLAGPPGDIINEVSAARPHQETQGNPNLDVVVVPSSPLESGTTGIPLDGTTLPPVDVASPSQEGVYETGVGQGTAAGTEATPAVSAAIQSSQAPQSNVTSDAPLAANPQSTPQDSQEDGFEHASTSAAPSVAVDTLMDGSTPRRMAAQAPTGEYSIEANAMQAADAPLQTDVVETGAQPTGSGPQVASTPIATDGDVASTEKAGQLPPFHWSATVRGSNCVEECIATDQVEQNKSYRLEISLKEYAESGVASTAIKTIIEEAATRSEPYTFKLVPLFVDGIGPARDNDAKSADLVVTKPGLQGNPWGTGTVKFSVLPEAKRCAQMIVSVWDTGLRVAYDAFIVTLPVTKDSDRSHCRDLLDPRIKRDSPSLVSMTDAFKADVSETDTEAENRISLYAFQLPIASKDSYAFAVLNAVDAPTEVIGWKLKRPLSRGFGVNSLNFNKMASQDRTRMIGAEEGEWIYENTSKFILDNLFAARGPRANETRMFEQIRRFINTRETVTFSVQLYIPLEGDDEYGMMFLPLRIMAAPGSKFFLKDFDQFSPLSGAANEDDNCISDWQLILNPKLDEGGSLPSILPSNEFTAEAGVIDHLKGLPPERWRMATLSSYDDIKNYFDPQPSANEAVAGEVGVKQQGGTGLIIAAHYGQGTLGLEGEKQLPISRIQKTFPSNSVAILAACETASPTEADGIINQLRERQVNAFLASPLKVPTDYALGFVEQLIARIDNAYRNRETPTINELFRDAMKAMETAPGNSVANKALGREYVLVGNRNLRLCKLPEDPGASSDETDN
jgi:hypothetical protein